MTTNNCQCGQPAVCFCAGTYYCLEHLPTTIPQSDFIAPLGSLRYAQATDMPDILHRLEKVELQVNEYEKTFIGLGPILKDMNTLDKIMAERLERVERIITIWGADS